MRVGYGYDVHKLVRNRDLIIGGVKIDYEYGLLGHSDADVLTHAIMDSILGAAALGDIGDKFPDNDERYRGANSIELLKEVGKMIEYEGYYISNIDCVIIAQKPKIAPYKSEMIDNISKALKIQKNQINIKATTEEELGFTGRLEGISAKAICLIEEMEEIQIYDDEGNKSCSSCCCKN